MLEQHGFLAVLLFGCFGGVANCLLSEGRFKMPLTERTEKGTSWHPGFLGNIFLGAVAAALTYSRANNSVFGLPQIGAALLSGIGGASILTSLVQRSDMKTLETKFEALTETVSKSADPNRRSRRK